MVLKLELGVREAVTKIKSPAGKAGAFTLALTRAAAPGEISETDLARAADFANAQLKSLPLKLMLLYLSGTLLFRAYALIRFGKRFEKLDSKKARKAYQAWAYSNWPLQRKLMRAIRSTALLAIYDSPDSGTE